MPALLFVSLETLETFIERTVKAAEGRIVAAVVEQLRLTGVRFMDGLQALRDEQAKQGALLTEMAGGLAEIGTDLDTLIAKLAEGQPGSAEVEAATAEAKQLTDRLAAIAEGVKASAAKFTPDPPA